MAFREVAPDIASVWWASFSRVQQIFYGPGHSLSLCFPLMITFLTTLQPDHAFGVRDNASLPPHVQIHPGNPRFIYVQSKGNAGYSDVVSATVPSDSEGHNGVPREDHVSYQATPREQDEMLSATPAVENYGVRL
jgi:hypothetical protein